MRYRWLIIFIGGIVSGLLVTDVSRVNAQGPSDTTVRTPGATVNLFETLDPTRPVDGVLLKLPSAWTFKDARLLRYGTEPVSFRTQSLDGEGMYRLAVERTISGPHELVVRVGVPERTGSFEWELHPFIWRKSVQDTAAESRTRQLRGKTQRVEVKEASPPEAANRALDLGTASVPLRLRTDRLPQLGRRSSFTVEFWMQTNGLDEIILSTWNGNESVAYPAEILVDRSGRLRFYSGRPGQHQALRSDRPVADGQWHHVASVYDAQRSRLRLFIDGTVTDSLRSRMPVAPGPVPVALGGRLNRELSAEEDRQPIFSGRLDELRIWSGARSGPTLRRMKGRPLRGAAGASSRDREVVRLGFESEEPSIVQQWPDGARRVPVTLSFRSSLRNLRANTDGRSVTLRWGAEVEDGQLFRIERSTDGRAFTTVAELDPSAAEQGTDPPDSEFTYTDENVPGKVVYYRVRQQRDEKTDYTSGTIKIGLGAAEDERRPVELIGNFPNPFAEATTVAYEVREPQPVTLTVWNVAGHRIAELVNDTKKPGYHETSVSATDLPSGTYFLRLETPSGTQTHRMVVLK